MVHHVLVEVHEGPQPRYGHGAERGAVAHAVHQLPVARGLGLLHQTVERALEAAAEQDPRRGSQVTLTDDEVRRQVDRAPALTEGGSVGTELLEEVAQLAALLSVEVFRHGR
jgi:hypothetical protein